ncbi:hypothetical protein BY458DRAFT_531096 [Sporodiniella umbellata]|nr:hypothetical protein BY458DRAFT_531096 [Sporodiniella umbellata]
MVCLLELFQAIYLPHQIFASKWEPSIAYYLYSFIAVLAVSYLGLVHHLRYKNLKYIQERYPDPDQILKDSKAAAEIVTITAHKEFVFSHALSLVIGLIKPFAIPEDAKLMLSTNQITKQTDRRYEETGLLVAEFFEIFGRIGNQLKENPQTSQEDIDIQWQRSQDAIKQMNKIHSFYNVKNDNYLHTIAIFVEDPIAWINKYEWRKLDIREINALYRFWYDIAEQMGLKNIPDSYEKLLEFRELTKPTIELMISDLPFSKYIFNFSCRTISSIMHPKAAAALGLPKGSKYLSNMVSFLFGLRAFFIRHFKLPRTSFEVQTPIHANSQGKYVPNFFAYGNRLYEDGYRISEVGPDNLLKTKRGCPFG